MWKSKKGIITAAVLVVSLVFLHFILTHLSFSATDSVGYHLFYISKNFKKIKKHDYVLFPIHETNIKEIQNELKKFKTIILVKQVACVPGDRLTVKGRKFYCNGQYLCTAKIRALDGEKINHFKFNGVVPNGYVFVLGKDVNSYDSRYFGFVPIKEVMAVAYPIL
ncbi:signal peptidase I [Hippea maritima]|uniref:Signal peptidase I n=1 Tax=Hippea maritima (strain ATCC 700847 / DSM 10411 / MH2) TaxID=760142 RepID=F2LV32_HIPMA|nr:signal peptidase I [Hippea maritima]AEA33616.1 Peptidase S26, conserved region [Hippea maritima DSM 10411]